MHGKAVWGRISYKPCDLAHNVLHSQLQQEETPTGTVGGAGNMSWSSVPHYNLLPDAP